eukprot:g4430.t1
MSVDLASNKAENACDEDSLAIVARTAIRLGLMDCMRLLLVSSSNRRIDTASQSSDDVEKQNSEMRLLKNLARAFASVLAAAGGCGITLGENSLDQRLWRTAQEKIQASGLIDEKFSYHIERIAYNIAALKLRMDGLHAGPVSVCDEGVFPISGSLDEQTNADVIFIHGLKGGPFKSWRAKIVKGESTRPFFLAEHLQRDISASTSGRIVPTVISLEYEASAVRTYNRPRTPLSIKDQAQLLASKIQTLRQGRSDEEKEKRPIIFIVHSLGGLLTKQLLVDNEDLRRACCGVCFYSTPHFGSTFADYNYDSLQPMIQSSPMVKQLRARNSDLVDLNENFQLFSAGIRCLSLGEGKAIEFSDFDSDIPEGANTLVKGFKIVEPWSSDPGFGQYRVLEDYTHTDICKPSSRNDLRYTVALDFCTESLTACAT